MAAGPGHEGRRDPRLRDHSPEELSFYSKATTDFEFLFPFGWGELWGVADRTDYDLKQHIEHPDEDLSYFDPATNQKYVPYVIEPSLGADRVALAFLCAAYDEEELAPGDVRTVLRFPPALAPVKIAVLPLVGQTVRSGRADLPAARARSWIVRIRRPPVDRQALPPAGRDRHALLRDL